MIPDLFDALDPPSPARDGRSPDKPPVKSRRGIVVAPAEVDPRSLELAKRLPGRLHLGTSSWSFSGWQGLVYADAYSDTVLARKGLAAYARHPLLRGVGVDRSFYASVPLSTWTDYARQVDDGFRFVVKAPASVCDAVLRDPQGRGLQPNPSFLDAELAWRDFIEPVTLGLGPRCGPLVFQFSPMPDPWLTDTAGIVARLREFFSALRRPDPQRAPNALLALELRDPELLTPRLLKMLRDTEVRYCLGLHAKMPTLERQTAALEMLEDGEPGPLIVRWNLREGLGYEQARAHYAPFNRIVDAAPQTRERLASLAVRALRAGQPVHITVNNKAEGSAPLSCFALAEAIDAQLQGA